MAVDFKVVSVQLDGENLEPMAARRFASLPGAGLAVACWTAGASSASAQGELPAIEWELILGGSDNEIADDVSQLADGRFAVAARTTVDGRFELTWILVSADGATLTTFRSAGADGLARAVEATEDGGCVIAGGRSGRVHLIQTEPNGALRWERSYAPGAGFAVVPALDGGYAVAGMSQGDVYLLKTDARGGVEWERRHGGAKADVGTWIREVPGDLLGDGVRISAGFIVAGITGSFAPAPGNNAYFLRVDASGERQWEHVVGTLGEDWAEGVTVTASGHIAFTGSSAGEFFLTLLDAGGTQVWHRLLGGLESNGLEELAGGGFVLGGLRHAPIEGDNEPRVVRTDAEGRELWSQVFVRAGHTGWFSAVEPTADGGFILAGSIRDRAVPFFDAHVVKLTAERPARTEFLRGDANGDRVLNIADAVAHLNRLFAGGATGHCDDAGDANDDGRLDVSDALHTLGFLFLGRQPPPEPFPQPGLEPTPDGLGCEA